MTHTAAEIEAFKAGFLEAAKWPSVCVQDAESRAVDDAARAYAATLLGQGAVPAAGVKK